MSGAGANHLVEVLEIRESALDCDGFYRQAGTGQKFARFADAFAPDEFADASSAS